MGLRGKMDHCVRLRFRKKPAHGPTVPDVDLPEHVIRGLQGWPERLTVAGVRKRVERHDFLTGRHQPPHHAGADESRSTRYQEFHAALRGITIRWSPIREPSTKRRMDAGRPTFDSGDAGS